LHIIENERFVDPLRVFLGLLDNINVQYSIKAMESCLSHLNNWYWKLKVNEGISFQHFRNKLILIFSELCTEMCFPQCKASA